MQIITNPCRTKVQHLLTCAGLKCLGFGCDGKPTSQPCLSLAAELVRRPATAGKDVDWDILLAQVGLHLRCAPDGADIRAVVRTMTLELQARRSSGANQKCRAAQNFQRWARVRGAVSKSATRSSRCVTLSRIALCAPASTVDLEAVTHL